MEYLSGMLGVGVLWCVFLFIRPDLRYRIFWTGALYAVVMTTGFFAVHFLKQVPEYQTITPGYWSPDTLFDLGRITGGFGIEDMLFLVFFGGIAGVLYEFVTNSPVHENSHPRAWPLSIPTGVVAAALVAHFGYNLMYSIIAFGVVGALVIWAQRPDLIRRSLIGGVSFLALYTGLYLAFLIFYPDFVSHTYHLTNVSGKLLLGIPVEEYLFAFGFGSMWSVIYSYRRNRA